MFTVAADFLLPVGHSRAVHFDVLSKPKSSAPQRRAQSSLDGAVALFDASHDATARLGGHSIQELDLRVFFANMVQSGR